MLLKLAAAAALALVLAGCGGGGEKKPAPATTSHLAPGCDVPSIERALRGYLAAVSSGDRAAIARRLSPADDFVRVTVIDLDGRRFSTTARAKAVAYLVSRHAQGERLRLIRLLVAPGVDANHVTVTGAVTRTARDTGRDVAIYDGAVSCVHGSITRWRLRPSG